MKTLIFVIALSSAFLFPASAADPEVLASLPATIAVKDMKPVPLKISSDKKGWIAIPEAFEQYQVTIFKPDRDQLGLVEFQVIADGYVLLACHFDYQGNRSGDWQEDALDAGEFKKLGWKEIRKSKLGGSLIQSDDRVQTIFYKKVHKGEYCKLRCNKYDPPYPILLHRVNVTRAD